MKPEIFATVMDFFNSGLPVVHEGAEISGDTEIYDDDDDTVQMIKVSFFFLQIELYMRRFLQLRSSWTPESDLQCRRMEEILSTWVLRMVLLNLRCRCLL